MEDVEAGDIVLYNEQNTGVPFIHRIVGVNSITQETLDGDTGELIDSVTLLPRHDQGRRQSFPRHDVRE